jgi:hypothetical protein
MGSVSDTPRSLRQSSSPSIRGIRMSSTTRSGRSTARGRPAPSHHASQAAAPSA